MIGGIDVSKGSGGLIITNGTIVSYFASANTNINPYTFVQIVNGTVTPSTSVINGVTLTKCTDTKAGKVYVLS